MDCNGILWSRISSGHLLWLVVKTILLLIMNLRSECGPVVLDASLVIHRSFSGFKPSYLPLDGFVLGDIGFNSLVFFCKYSVANSLLSVMFCMFI